MLEDRDAQIRCAGDGFGEPLVGLATQRHVERGRRHAGAQALRHRVAAQHRFGLVGAPGRPTAIWDWARLAAGWLGRMCAGGVGPRPSSPRRRWPPEPTVGPFLVPDLFTAPRRRELPAIYLPSPPSVHCGPSAVSVTSMPRF